jgi:hypothetical protein
MEKFISVHKKLLAFMGLGKIKLDKFLTGCLVLSFGIILTYIFSLFWVQGRIILIEPNKLILLSETIMSVLIVAFGVRLLLRT